MCVPSLPSIESTKMGANLQITREKNALLTVLKDLKRAEIQSLCKVKQREIEGKRWSANATFQTHNIKGTNRARNLLELSLADHCVNEYVCSSSKGPESTT